MTPAFKGFLIGVVMSVLSVNVTVLTHYSPWFAVLYIPVILACALAGVAVDEGWL